MKSSKKKKICSVNVRMTSKEKSLIKRRAQKLGISESEYVRSCIFSEKQLQNKELQVRVSKMETLFNELLDHIDLTCGMDDYVCELEAEYEKFTD